MKHSSGISLVELLVVFGILSVVAVSALAAIDPVEQIRKARDAAKLKDAAELLRGYGRYFGVHKCYPWYEGAPECTSEEDSRLFMATVPDFSASGADYQLITGGYLKDVFVGRRSIENGEFLVSTDEDRRGASVCYEPESKKGRSGALLGLRDSVNQTNQTCAGSEYPDNSCFVCVGF